MTLRNSSLSVDFGDNQSITVALYGGVPIATNNTEQANDHYVYDSDEAIVRISHNNNYGSTCELRIEMSHIYTVEGDFNISVTALAARLEEMTVTTDWTVQSVRSPVTDVCLRLDSAVAVQQNVTAAVSAKPISQFARYYWTVSRFDSLVDRTNSSVVLAADTDVPELELILSEVGDYLINVMVQNEVSVSNDDAVITAVEAISAVSLSCNHGKHFSTNATFDCIAAVDKGADVGFMWDFAGGFSIHVTTGSGSSTATVTYPTVGKYNITVTAWNQLGAETAWLTVNIAENVSGDVSHTLIHNDHLEQDADEKNLANSLGSISTSLNISVLHPYTIRCITVDPVSLDQPVVLEAIISSDLNFTVMLDFADGNIVNSSAAAPHPDIDVTPLSDSLHNTSSPVYLLTVRHRYITPGNHLVSLSVTDEVSHVSKSLMVSVADKDFIVTLTADRESPIMSSSLISLNASATVDDDVSFGWTCERCTEKPLVHRYLLVFTCMFI